MLPSIAGRVRLSGHHVGRTATGWWAQAGRDIVLLDRALAVVATVPIGTDWRAAHAVGPAADLVAVSDRDAVRVLTAGGAEVWSFRHTSWGTDYSLRGSCAFTADGSTLWATMPETEALFDGDGESDGDDEVDGWGDQWCAFDATTGAIRRWGWLEAEATGSLSHPHASGAVLLDVGEGQDGSRIYIGDAAAGIVALPGSARALADVDGDRFLSVPRDGTGLMVHAFPSGTALATEAGPSLPDAEWYGTCAGFLDGDRILAGTVGKNWAWRRDLVLDATDLSRLGEIDYPEAAGSGAIAVAGDGTWLTATDTELIAWRLAG